MSLEEFVKEINKIQNPELKQKQIKKHIKREYCPVKEKIDFLNRIYLLSKKDNNTIDLCLNKIYLSVGIISLYTDICIDQIYINKDILFYYYDIIINTIDFFDIISDDLEEIFNFNSLILL